MKVDKFKCSALCTVQSNVQCTSKVRKQGHCTHSRVKWEEMSVKRIGARMKGSIVWRQEAKLEVAGSKMLRFSLGVTRMDRIRNGLSVLKNKNREARLKWSEHVQRRYSGYIGQGILKMEFLGWRTSVEVCGYSVGGLV